MPSHASCTTTRYTNERLAPLFLTKNGATDPPSTSPNRGITELPAPARLPCGTRCYRLWLLPSGPDQVHGAPLHRTQPSSPSAQSVSRHGPPPVGVRPRVWRISGTGDRQPPAYRDTKHIIHEHSNFSNVWSMKLCGTMRSTKLGG